MTESNKDRLEQPNMITLTYGNTSPSKQTMKEDFHRFIKQFRFHISKKHGVTPRYLQAHEMNTSNDGVERCHHHVLTSHDIPANLIHKWWNNAVNRPRAKQGLPTQELYPSVTKAHDFGNYIAKYLNK